MSQRALKQRISDLEISDSDSVHGVCTNLSLIKSSSKNPKVNYFSGQLSDSTGI